MICSSAPHPVTSLVNAHLLGVYAASSCALFASELFAHSNHSQAKNSILLQINCLSFRSDHNCLLLWKACLTLQRWSNCLTGLVATVELR